MANLFTAIANETPATTDLISKVLVGLREDSEIEIVTKEGRSKPRSASVDWTAFDMSFLLVLPVSTSAAPLRLPSARAGRLW
jgi:hypothetical protein